MKVLIARMNHETNTFSPVPTPLSAFGNDGPTYDAAAYEREQGQAHRHVRLHRPGRSARRRAGHAGVGHGLPSRAAGGRRYRELCDRIVAAAPGCDALLLDLHGAMAVETTDDGEGDLLERLRRAAPSVPVAVALDLHGNVTQKMVDNADVIISFKTYPHVDMYETGEHAGRILFDWLAGGPRPALAWRRLPLMTHTLRSATAEGAMREAVQAARQAEQGAVLGVSVLAGFALADPRALPERGGGGRGRGRTRGAERALRRWPTPSGPTATASTKRALADSLARAARLAEGANKPVLLLDHGDNCMSGGTCDTMDVLMAALDAGLTGIQAGLYCDPEAVAAMARGPGRHGGAAGGQQAAHRRHRPRRRAGDAARRGARAHQWRVRDHRPDLHRADRLHGPQRGAGPGRGAAGADQPHARALGPGRVRKPGPGPARRASCWSSRACIAGRCSCPSPARWSSATARASPARTTACSPTSAASGRCIRWSRWRSRTIAPRLERRAAILSNGGLRARRPAAPRSPYWEEGPWPRCACCRTRKSARFPRRGRCSRTSAPRANPISSTTSGAPWLTIRRSCGGSGNSSNRS